MKIDCSKLSNKSDLIALLCFIITVGVLVFIVYLTMVNQTFMAGLLSASIYWNWKRLIYDPLDTLVDRVWGDENK